MIEDDAGSRGTNTDYIPVPFFFSGLFIYIHIYIFSFPFIWFSFFPSFLHSSPHNIGHIAFPFCPHPQYCSASFPDHLTRWIPHCPECSPSPVPRCRLLPFESLFPPSILPFSIFYKLTSYGSSRSPPSYHKSLTVSPNLAQQLIQIRPILRHEIMPLPWFHKSTYQAMFSHYTPARLQVWCCSSQRCYGRQPATCQN